ncbi:MAG: phosphopyruvate hydratase [Eubacteriales bacterium]
MQSSIQTIRALEVLDSRGNPTLAVQVTTQSGACGQAMVPSGASTGAFEACELRDGGQRYGGKGVAVAQYHVNHLLADALRGMPVDDQRAIDQRLLQLDGTPDKHRLGANALLGVSMACAQAAAAARGVPLYRYLGGSQAHRLPVPMMNVINGGRHAEGNLSCQEFMIMPNGADSFPECVRWCAEVYHALGSLLRQKGFGTAVGDEGGYAPALREDAEAIEYILEAIRIAGFQPGYQFCLALDPAATEMYDAAKEEGCPGNYYFWKLHRMYTPQALMDLWEDWCRQYPIRSIEDPLAEEDWENFTKLTARLGNRVQLVGDDLLVTNTARLEKAIGLHACNAILIKVNQIGTLSEAMDAVERAQRVGWNAIISHRSGDTEDTFIADLAVATGSGQIKTGAPCRGERTAKYNRLLTICQQLGPQALYTGLWR